MNRSLMTLWISFVALLAPVHAQAQVPHVIRYQGTATDGAGVPLEGPYTVTCRLYDAATAGIKLWEEVTPNVTMTSGRFSLTLGTLTPLSLPFDQEYWVSIELNQDGEMSPRQKLGAVPYAIAAESAERLHESQRIASQNLIKNGSFESWSQGPSAAPDGWTLGGGGAAAGSATKDVTNVRADSAAVAVTRPANDLSLNYVLPSSVVTTLQGKSASLGCWVRATEPNQARILLNAGAGGDAPGYSPYHPGDGTWRFLTVTRTIPTNETGLNINLNVEATPGTVQFDGLMLVEGPMPLAFSPHPNDEHLRISNFQTLTGTNLTDQGLWRVETGVVQLTGSPSATTASQAVTFAKPFRTVRIVVATGQDYQSAVGGKRCIWTARNVTTSGFTIEAVTHDGQYFANTGVGNGAWIAIGQD